MVQYLRIRLLPVNTLGLLGPERLRLRNRTLIKLAIRHNALLLNLRLMSRVSDNKQIHILIDRHLLQASSVQGDIQDALLLTGRELTRQVDFELLDQNREQIAVATSAWLIINTKTRRLVPVQRLDLNLPCLEELHGLNETLDKINLPSAGEECLRRIAGYSSVDIVGHVNNSRYPEWICDAFPTGYYQNHQFDWIQINYNHETLPGEEVMLFKEPLDENGLWGIQGYNNNHSTTSFESLVKWKN